MVGTLPTWGVSVRITLFLARLAYASEADAEKMKNQLLQQAKDAGAEVIEAKGTYRTVYGSMRFNVGGIVRSKLGPRIYSIGVENLSTRFSRLSPEAIKNISLGNVIKDGYKYEKICQDYLQSQQDQKQAKQDIIDKNLARFETEIADITEVEQILTIFLKYAGQKIDKEKLITLTAKKIQGEPKQEKTNDWFDELSDINN